MIDRKSLLLPLFLLACLPALFAQREGDDGGFPLRAVHHSEAGRIEIFPADDVTGEPVLTQMALPAERPYLHPLRSPKGGGVLTEYRPRHHPHQTGIYWGLKRVNGRDFFMGWNRDHWRRVSATVLEETGPVVRWRVIYNLLDEEGKAILAETLTWSMRRGGDAWLVDLLWSGEAKIDVKVGEFFVGGLFVRMPWHQGIDGYVVNANGQLDGKAEGQRAIWADVGMAIQGIGNHGRIAVFDHPSNAAFPTPWRVDGELGMGPSRQILGSWQLAAGKVETARYRLFVYEGTPDIAALNRAWTDFATNE